MVILDEAMAGMNKGDEIYHCRHKPAKRQRIYTMVMQYVQSPWLSP